MTVWCIWVKGVSFSGNHNERQLEVQYEVTRMWLPQTWKVYYNLDVSYRTQYQILRLNSPDFTIMWCHNFFSLWLQNWQMWTTKQDIFWDRSITAQVEPFGSFEVVLLFASQCSYVSSCLALIYSKICSLNAYIGSEAVLVYTLCAHDITLYDIA